MLFFLLFVALIAAWLSWFFRAKSAGAIPGPPAYPLIGSTIELVANLSRMPMWQAECAAKYGGPKGTWGLGTFGRRILFVTDPGIVKYILQDCFDNFIKGPGIAEPFWPLFHNGIFTADGESWYKQRKAASHLFSAKLLRGTFLTAFTHHTNELVKFLDTATQTSKVVDVQTLLFASAMDVICDIVFGKQMDTLHNPHPFTVAFDKANAFCFRRYFTPYWKLLRFFNMGFEAPLAQCEETIEAFVMSVVEERLAAPSFEEDVSATHIYADALTTHIQQYRKRGEVIDKEILRDVVMSFIIAGRDTTAWTLSVMFYMLTQRPDVEAKILAEINDVIARNGVVDYVSVDQLHYVKAFAYEVLRLYPAVPCDSKFAVADAILPDGTQVLAGDMVNYPAWSQGRDPHIWDNPTEFTPERWLENGEFVQVRDQYAYAAFNGGKRICIGKEASMLHVRIVLATILPKFKFTSPPRIFEGQDPPFIVASTLSWDKLPMTVEMRKA